MNEEPAGRTADAQDQPGRLRRGWRALSGGLAATATYLVGDRRRRRWGAPVLALFVLLALWLVSAPFVMVFNYGFPEPSPRTGVVAEEGQPPGVAYVDALLRVHEDGMRPWLVNDRVMPTILLDNPQHFQRGELEAMRYGVRLLRDNLSRQRSTDAIDPDVEKAYNSLAISAESWWLPRAEGEYDKARRALERFRARLVSGHAQFHPRVDNLVELLKQMNSLTGGANTRLYNCIGDLEVRLSEETAEDPILSGERVVDTDVAWSAVDDHFYYARGVAYVYREIMLAVLHDFRDVLEVRNGDELAESIVTDFLDHAQFEPLYVANGSYGSLWANHPYQLLGLLSQVRERSRSLISVLSVDVT